MAYMVGLRRNVHISTSKSETIGLELCNLNGSVKMLFKYITKGQDQVTFKGNFESGEFKKVNSQNDIKYVYYDR